MKFLAFGHEKDVGKDTAAKFAMSHLRSNSIFKSVQKRGFAEKIKQICFELYSWTGLMPGPYYDEPENKKLKEVILPLIGKSPRQIWIDFGQGVRHSTYNETWLDYLLLNTKCDFLIITDLRFPEEAERIQKYGGWLVKILRPSIPHTSDAADDPLLTYEKWNCIIKNDQDLEYLHTQVIDVVKAMLVYT